MMTFEEKRKYERMVIGEAIVSRDSNGGHIYVDGFKWRGEKYPWTWGRPIKSPDGVLLELTSVHDNYILCDTLLFVDDYPVLKAGDILKIYGHCSDYTLLGNIQMDIGPIEAKKRTLKMMGDCKKLMGK